MTESLADGPDWHLRSHFALPFHFSPLWMNGAAPRLTNSMNSILEDKELMKIHADLQKTFPDKLRVSQMLGGPSLRHGDTKESLSNPSGVGCGVKDTGRLVTWEFPLRTNSAS